MRKIIAERRGLKRIKIDLPIRYCYHDIMGPAASREATALDISSGGISFKVGETFSLSTILKVEVDLPAFPKPVEILVKVIRVEQTDKENNFIVGATVIRINEQDKQKITIYFEQADILELFQATVDALASDLHLSVNHPPILRVGGELQPIRNKGVYNSMDLKRIIYSIMTEEQIKFFEENLELDFSYSVSPIIRFRVNVHLQRGNVEAAFRRIEARIKTIQELGLPTVVADLARKRRGIVLLTGATGSGKTTTMTAMVDLINSERECLIITLEDPIEYVHVYKKSIIKQREIGMDTKSFATALRHAMRQDPDVIVVGEIRDLETISTALAAAETGHLIIATLPSYDAAQSISHIVHMFPAQQQRQIRLQLADTLQGIVNQVLLPRADNPFERVVATETLITTSAVRNIIREQRLEQLPYIIQTGSQFGMHTMQNSLERLHNKGIITKESMMKRSKS